MASLLKDQVAKMCHKFNVKNRIVSYHLIQTTMGIGEFNQNLLGKNSQFDSVKNYKGYYGYIDNKCDEDEEENDE